jgi:DNA adenine methylase Dam
METKKVKTLFKYIGGKAWLKDNLREEFTRLLQLKKPIAYVEPFTGGLGAFLSVYDLLFNAGVKQVTLNDINPKLINFYKCVESNPEKLIKEYMILETGFSKTIPTQALALHSTKDKEELKKLLIDAELFFKNIRNKFNEETDIIKNSAQLLFLQKHCFNGVYRENSQGKYNTPFNWDAKSFPEEQIREKILDVNNVFKQFEMIFSIGSFEHLQYRKDTLYYLDPPYINTDVTENKYNKAVFDLNKQKLLIDKITQVPFLYSNHENDLLIKEFQTKVAKFKLKKIPRKNIISASNESRKTDKIEILVTSE